MLKRPQEDLFQDTTMTFGEHLDELRRCLLKAVLGLMVGFGIGLYFGKDIVRALQSPLQSALKTYYSEAALEELAGVLREREVPQSEIAWTQAHLAEIIFRDEMLFEFFYVNPQHVTGMNANSPKLSPMDLLTTSQPTPKYESLAALAADLETVYADQLEKESLTLPESEGTYADNEAMLQALKKLNPKLPKDARVPPPKLRKADLAPVLFWHPMSQDERIRLKSFNAQETFMIYLKAALVLGAVVASPWIFWQIWTFVAAGLYPHERRYLYLYGPISLGLFWLGAVFAFFAVFQPVLYFLLGFNRMMGIDPDPRITEWLSFVVILPLAFGVSFQLPMVMLFLERIGIFNVRQYIARWRIAVLVIFIVSAVLTPADPYTIFFMAIPLTLLYFLAIVMCKYLPRAQSAMDEA